MKYKSKTVIVEGIKFASKKEANRFKELKFLESIGVIQNLELQKRFELLPTQREPKTMTKTGKEKLGKVIERPVYYIADFVYMKDGETVVEDTKGFKTKEYIIKRKLMLYVYGIRIIEV